MTDREREQVFEIWEAAGGLWSPWVKPVVFATLMRVHHEPEEIAPDLSAIQVSRGTIYVLDLPGAEGISAGMALVRQGCRPVPLYNAVPGLAGPWYDFVPPSRHMDTVDMTPILAGLLSATGELRSIQLPQNSPPVFLLDARRRGEGVAPLAGSFDNRSVSFVTDFPAATFLLAQGYRKAVLVQRNEIQPQADLAHTLRRWQEAGIALEVLRPGLDVVPLSFQVRVPSDFRFWWQRILAAAGLRRSPLGGFGGSLPEHSGAG